MQIIVSTIANKNARYNQPAQRNSVEDTPNRRYHTAAAEYHTDEVETALLGYFNAHDRDFQERRAEEYESDKRRYHRAAQVCNKRNRALSCALVVFVYAVRRGFSAVLAELGHSFDLAAALFAVRDLGCGVAVCRFGVAVYGLAADRAERSAGGYVRTAFFAFMRVGRIRALGRGVERIDNARRSGVRRSRFGLYGCAALGAKRFAGFYLGAAAFAHLSFEFFAHEYLVPP